MPCHPIPLACLLLSACLPPLAQAATIYLAPDGDDAAAGTREHPFATIMRAQQAAAAGDTVLLRGGTYRLGEESIAKRQGIWAYVILLDKSGHDGQRINYWAHPHERPVFDFSAVKPAGLRVHAFQITGSWLHLKGIEVTGVQVTIRSHTQSICCASDGSHNILESLRLHDGMAIGIYHINGSDNLFLNCDAWRNHDYISEDGKGGNTDGFGCHPRQGGTGNVFRNCRAWFNSDDGFDCINAHEPVTFDGCWAFCNGFSPTFERLGDGNGFKAGGYGSTPADRLPPTIPRHVVRGCLAVRNRANGFYANHHIGGCDWLNNTGWRNATDFNMLARRPDNLTDVPGYAHRLFHNASVGARHALVQCDLAACTLGANAFGDGIRAGDRDFISLDETQLTAARQDDGSLPVITLLRPRPDSPLADPPREAVVPIPGCQPFLGAVAP